MKKSISLLGLFCALAVCTYAQPSELIIRKSENGLYLEHKVAPKEGLYAIGRLYNVNPKFIAIFNNIDLNAGLAIGQTLQIPLTDTNFTQKSINGTPVYYITGAGDNLVKVSNSYNKVSTQNLRDWNGLKNDAPSPGSRLIVGFLNSKEMAAVAINNTVKMKTNATPTGDKAAASVAEKDPPAEKSPQRMKVYDNAPVKTDNANEGNQVLKQEGTKAEPVSAVTRELDSKPANTDQGYFKISFDQQTRRSPVTKKATVTSGIFKTSSGWQDSKYYMLIDNVPTGTIVKLINPGNNRVVYAKVLGEMKGIRQNEGLDIRISNAAAATMGIADTDKFILQANY
jgi:hypothetical protein